MTEAEHAAAVKAHAAELRELAREYRAEAGRLERAALDAERSLEARRRER